ncbi:aminoglycoside phosphotransferase, partial [Mycobacterium sp. ITM-2017-0098]
MVTSRGLTDAGAAVPRAIGHVTAEWLTTVLRADDTIADTAIVTDIRVEQIAFDSGFSSQLYRAHLTGDGIPASLIIKLPAESDAGGAMRTLGGYQREVDFYRYV